MVDTKEKLLFQHMADYKEHLWYFWWRPKHSPEEELPLLEGKVRVSQLPTPSLSEGPWLRRVTSLEN